MFLSARYIRVYTHIYRKSGVLPFSGAWLSEDSYCPFADVHIYVINVHCVLMFGKNDAILPEPEINLDSARK